MNDDEKILLELLPGLRDVDTLDTIKTEQSYIDVINKLQIIFSKYSEKNTIKELKTAIKAAKLISKLEMKLRVLNKQKISNFSKKILLSTKIELEASEQAKASLLGVRILAKHHVIRKTNSKKGGLARQKSADQKQVLITDICRDYAKAHPDKLSQQYCKRNVKARIMDIILKNKIVSESTANKRRKTAFSELSFPETIT